MRGRVRTVALGACALCFGMWQEARGFVPSLQRPHLIPNRGVSTSTRESKHNVDTGSFGWIRSGAARQGDVARRATREPVEQAAETVDAWGARPYAQPQPQTQPQTATVSSLREEIRTKLQSLFGAFSDTVGGVLSPELLSGESPVLSSLQKAREHFLSNEPLATGGRVAAAAIGVIPEPVNSNIARISEAVPNTWLPVMHSADLKAGSKGLTKVVVDEQPICLFRVPSGEVKAISDICLHRAAALSDGWLEDDMVVCPYHAYKFDGEGKLRCIPGVDDSILAKNKRVARTVSYKTMEQGGLIYIFPDAMRAGAIEQHVKPFLLPEAVDPAFRVVEGTAEIQASANLVVENLLDMLHISYVHTFGNMQEPLPYQETYDIMYDDEANQLLPYARTTFRYRSGPRSISKVVGKVQEVIVENEFHIPYTTVTRVRFANDIKTIYVVNVPVSEGRTVVHYKLYRNFMYVHPKDQSLLNKALDQFFQSVMRLTLDEDRRILESLYADHQRGYVLSRYDKPLKLYRRTIKEFLEATKAREQIAERRTLEMELLRLIESTERGRKATRGQHETILQIVGALERSFATQLGGGEESAESFMIEDSAVNGSWHLVYANPGNLSSTPMFASSASASSLIPAPVPVAVEAPATMREARDHLIYPNIEDQKFMTRLKTAGAERYLLDPMAKGRPIWADTEQSMQTIDMAKSVVSNTAVYVGLLGIRTTVELNGVFSKVGATRKDVSFKSAQVDIGGFKVTFPHMDLFGINGWIETTFVDEHIRICRGNRGSIFVLTRRPLAPA